MNISTLTKEQLKVSSYNVMFSTNHENIIYNTRTGALLSLDNKTSDAVLDILNSLEGRADYIETLLQNGFVIKQDFDELESIIKIHNNYMNDEENIDITILPSESCNLSCSYCFIYTQRDIFMDDITYDNILKYIIKQVKPFGNKTVNINWYGGEPTLSYKKIINFMNNLYEIKKEYNLKINSSIVTNGVLLSRDVFIKLYNAGIRSFQVTIDGDKETHDYFRKTKDGEPTFEIIFANLQQISELDSSYSFNFSIRANFLDDAEESMHGLLSTFNEKFNSDKRFTIYFRPIYNFNTDRKDIKAIENSICNLETGNKVQLDLEYAARLSQSDSNQMLDFIPKPIYSWCNVVKKNFHIIGADGTIFACDTLLVDKEDGIGFLSNEGDIVLNQNAKKWKQNFLVEEDNLKDECLTCTILPLCMGGCRRNWIMDKKKVCSLDMKVLERIVKRYVLENDMITG
ncbi:radical SAM/SPASM domain-containing protein [Fusibacter tunisiensis]|uniref:Radical SAM core domain-containing protein n=1 Tax=Fusibacter tunisiensis TaxID=1008308 RepID=A0ABS2MTE9_9FIRM|nr:radical SAM protein [Fusibacter tunisiensis]MBM7562625.1 uncharacterized protein [Fusibacter tunisiensis]